MKSKKVSGSVIQRSMVLKDVSTVLNVASVPSTDIGHKESLKATVAELVGVSTSDCLTSSEYHKALKVATNPEFWVSMIDYIHGHPILRQCFRRCLECEWCFEEWQRYFKRYFKEWQEQGIKLFFDDVLLCQLSGVDTSKVLPWFLCPTLFPHFLYDTDFKYLERKFYQNFELEFERFNVSLKIRAAASLAPERIRLSLGEMYNYHVPFGQSPECESETLRKIVEKAKDIVLAPLLTGAMKSATLISANHYILAVECALASGTSAIIFLATISIADQILEYLCRRRQKEE